MTAESTPTPRANLMDIGKPAGGCGCGGEHGSCGCGGHGEGGHGHHSKEHFQAKLDALRTAAPAAEENR